MLDHIVVQPTEVNLKKDYSFLIFYAKIYLVQRENGASNFLLAWKTILLENRYHKNRSYWYIQP